MVKPAYSSIIGNLIYRETGLPDMCLASIEIARRANLFNLIYIEKVIEKQSIIYPEQIYFDKAVKLLKSLEEFKLNYSKINSWKTLGFELNKNSKMMYRVLLSSVKMKVFELNSYRSYVIIHKL